MKYSIPYIILIVLSLALLVSHTLIEWIYSPFLVGLSIFTLMWSILNLLFDLSAFYRYVILTIAYCGLWFLQGIAWIRGYRVSIAQGRELEEVYKLRYQVYLEKGYIEESPEETFVDEFDPYSENVILTKRGNGIIGSMRIAFSNDHVFLPTQNYFNFDSSSESMVELGRWVMLREFRKKHSNSPFFTIIICLSTYLYLLKKQEQYMIFSVQPWLKTHLEELFHVPIDVKPKKELTPWNIQKQTEQLQGYFNKTVFICEVKITIWKLTYFIFQHMVSKINLHHEHILIPQHSHKHS